MSFISYAQNFEDVMLWRALKHVEHGFYIDVGANDPDTDSVTKAFYERGWRGINIDPVPQWHKALSEKRQRDINLQLAITEQAGQRTFYDVENTGLSTLVEGHAKSASDLGYGYKSISVQCATLEEVWKKYGLSEVHFLKVDVEGAEEEVLRSLDMRVHRPWILVVEATRPMSQVAVHESFEPLLLENNYRFVYFDGLNRFYVAEEHYASLADAFSAPPNVFDDFMRATEHRARQENTRLAGLLQVLRLPR